MVDFFWRIITLESIILRATFSSLTFFFSFSSSSNDSRNNCIYIIDIQCGENLKPNYNKPKCLQYLSN